LIWLGWIFVGGTYALNDLEEDYSEEGVYFRPLLVCPGHLGFHPARERAGGLQGACDDEDSGEEKP
jgi:hypothetical protein